MQCQGFKMNFKNNKNLIKMIKKNKMNLNKILLKIMNDN